MLILWNAVSGEVLNRHTGRNYDLHKLAFSPQGDRLLGARGAFASVFDPNKGEDVGPILGHASAASSVEDRNRTTNGEVSRSRG
jgi:hypothetical protein